MLIDPNLIFVGQTLYLPRITPSGPGTIIAKTPVAPKAGLAVLLRPDAFAKPKMRSIPLKYSLSDLPSITVVSPTYVASIALKGSLTLQKLADQQFKMLHLFL